MSFHFLSPTESPQWPTFASTHPNMAFLPTASALLDSPLGGQSQLERPSSTSRKAGQLSQHQFTQPRRNSRALQSRPTRRPCSSWQQPTINSASRLTASASTRHGPPPESRLSCTCMQKVATASVRANKISLLILG